MYYHVSSFLKEFELLTKETKNNYEYCKMACGTDVSSYDKLVEFMEKLNRDNVKGRTGKDCYKWASEAIFEWIRSTFYPDMPSRIWGIFISDSFESALDFKKKYRDDKAHIFEMPIPHIQVYKFDMNLYTIADENLRNNFSEASYQECVQKAKEYWTQTDRNINVEFLFEADIVTVGKKVEYKSNETL